MGDSVDTDDVLAFTIVPNNDYVAPSYEPPKVFSAMGRIVESVVVGGPDLDIETPNSILAFASGDRNEQVEYVEGMVGVGIFCACLVSVWLAALLLLKCTGRDRVGCAAGFAFHDAESETPVSGRRRRRRKDDDDDASDGAAVGDDDSVARDEGSSSARTTGKKKTKMFPGLSSAFGRKKKVARESSLLQEESDDGDDNNNNHKNSFIYDSRALDEIELHMELDNIVQSATRDSETKTMKDQENNTWALRSIPRDVVRFGDESSSGDGGGSTDKNNNNKERSKVGGKACGKTRCCSFEPKHVARRRFQTRLVFALFAIVSLVSCVLLITHMYRPLESATRSTANVIGESAKIVDEIDGVLGLLEEAATATLQSSETFPVRYEEVCPETEAGIFRGQFGFNPQSTMDLVSSEYLSYIPSIVETLNDVQATGDSVTAMLVDVDESINTASEYLWIIVLIICVTMLIIFSQLALMMAVVYKEQKFKDITTKVPWIEDCYGWTILPLQTFVVLVSWLLVIAFCFGMIITTDSCMPSLGGGADEAGANNNGRGTPDDTVLAVIDQYLLTNPSVTTTTPAAADATLSVIEDLAKKRLATYITGCAGVPDPLLEVIAIQGVLQESLAKVDKELSFARDVLGLDSIKDSCGPMNRVDAFFSGAQDVNGRFKLVNKALLQSYDALSCPRVNALYVEAVHGALCTDFAAANANGLVLLVLISISGMVLITLRASWRSTV
mmetsp:Transcript_102077/g.207607  ORF Transcript_102077/g.207607 Transcript_102077/m.207607 type:complete len:729 (+) Transcript_102077:339-2525(+)